MTFEEFVTPMLLPGTPAGVASRQPAIRWGVARRRDCASLACARPNTRCYGARGPRGKYANGISAGLRPSTTLTRNLRPLIDAGWVAIRPGEDRREKLVRLTDAGTTMLHEARPAWERAQERCARACRKRPGQAFRASSPN